MTGRIVECPQWLYLKKSCISDWNCRLKGYSYYSRKVKPIFHQAFLVALGQVTQSILRWEHFKYFFH